MAARKDKINFQLFFNPEDPSQAKAAEILGGRTMKSAYVADAICFYEACSDKEFMAAATKFRETILKSVKE